MLNAAEASFNSIRYNLKIDRYERAIEWLSFNSIRYNLKLLHQLELFHFLLFQFHKVQFKGVCCRYCIG